MNSKISFSVLRRAYFDMAELMLELSKPEFLYIGVIRQDESGVWTVLKRPLTCNMNRLYHLSNIPHSIFGRHHFSNVADYFEDVAQYHFCHLEFQSNGAISDRVDCRKK